MLCERNGVTLDILHMREARGIAMGRQTGMSGRQGIGGHDGGGANIVQHLVRGVLYKAVSKVFGWKDTSIGFSVFCKSCSRDIRERPDAAVRGRGDLQAGARLGGQNALTTQRGIAVGQQAGQREDGLGQHDGPQVQRDGLQVRERLERHDQRQRQCPGTQRVLVVAQRGFGQALEPAQVVQVRAAEAAAHGAGQLTRENLFEQADVGAGHRLAEIGHGHRQRRLFRHAAQVDAHEIFQGDLGTHSGLFAQQAGGIGELGGHIGVQPFGCVCQQGVGNVGQELEHHGTKAVRQLLMQAGVQGGIDA